MGMDKFLAVLKDDSGATALEYALILVFIALAIFSAVTGLGTATSNSFDTAAGKL
ncbi:MAG: Flp family type IVb pilin [Pseudomonadota bacterium]